MLLDEVLESVEDDAMDYVSSLWQKSVSSLQIFWVHTSMMASYHVYVRTMQLFISGNIILTTDRSVK